MQIDGVLPMLPYHLPEVILYFSESGWDFFCYLSYAVSMEAQLCWSILSKREIEHIDTWQTSSDCIKQFHTMGLTYFCIPLILAVPRHNLHSEIIKDSVWSRLFLNERILPLPGCKIWLMQEEVAASKVFHM